MSLAEPAAPQLRCAERSAMHAGIEIGEVAIAEAQRGIVRGCEPTRQTERLFGGIACSPRPSNIGSRRRIDIEADLEGLMETGMEDTREILARRRR